MSKESFWVLLENGIVNSLGSYGSLDIEGGKLKKNYWVRKKIPKSSILNKDWHPINGSSEPNNS